MANHKNGRSDRWTEDETNQALRMRAEGAIRRQIAERIGRSFGSVKSRFALVKLTPEQLAQRRAGIVKSDSVRRARVKAAVPTVRPGPTPAQLAEREFRFSHIPTISQMLFGDPLPGQSALDKRMGA